MEKRENRRYRILGPRIVLLDGTAHGLRLLLFWISGLRATFVSNPNFVLYDRLMNNYRIDFVQTDDSCNRTEWETNETDVPSVPRDKLEKVKSF